MDAGTVGRGNVDPRTFGGGAETLGPQQSGTQRTKTGRLTTKTRGYGIGTVRNVDRRGPETGGYVHALHAATGKNRMDTRDGIRKYYRRNGLRGICPVCGPVVLLARRTNGTGRNVALALPV